MRIGFSVRLAGLRYRLLWAQARTGAGKAALIVVGLMLFYLVDPMVALRYE